MKRIQLILGMALCTMTVGAQTQECGTEFNINEYNSFVRSHHQRIRAKTVSSNNVLYFPIQYHIFKNSNGDMALSVSETQNMTKMLNYAYQNSNIQFYSCNNVDVITNNTYYNLIKSQESGLSVYDNPNAINVYLCNTINNGSYAGYSYYPWMGTNRIFIAKDYANTSTVPHEFGHYFGLLHTHDTQYGVELVDGSNCGTAGDRICDTPADPMLDYNTVDCDCNYIGNQYQNGLPYSPDTRNLMSYSRKECRTQFTSGQISVIQYYAQSTRFYLVDTELITNRTITGSETYVNDIVEVENTKVQSGGSLIIDFCESTTLNGPFEVELGATLEIK